MSLDALLMASRSGDPEAGRALVTALYASLRAFFRRHCSPADAGYLRARVGGPRWKLQSSLGRLAEAGQIERSGTTAATRYWLADPRGN